MTDAEPTPPPRLAGRSGRAIAWFIAVTLVVLAADLVIKHLAFRHVAGEPVVLTPDTASDPDFMYLNHPHEPVVVLPSVLSLQLTTNTGAVFGLGKGNRTFFIAVSLVAVGLIGWMFWTSPRESWGRQLAFALILAGALGNLYDRAIYSQVRDMFHLFPGVELPFGLSWPGNQRSLYPWIFNLADVSLLAGVAMLFVITLRQPRQHAPAAQTAAG